MTDAHDTRQHHGSASATGPHQHRRAWIEHEGIRVGYAVCALGTKDAPWCPDGPDPWAVMTRKHADAIVASAEQHERVVCDRHPPERWRTYSGNRICLDCRAAKRRTQRIGRRIARDAVRVA